MAYFTTVFLLMRSSTAVNSSGLSPILTSNSWKLLLPPPLLLLSSRNCSQPSSLPLLVLPSTERRHHLLSGYCVKSFLQVDEPRSHTALYLQSLLYHLSQDVHPDCGSSTLPEPLLNSPSALLLILASKTLSNSFSTWLSSVMPLYFPVSFPSPFLFHICTVRPILHSFDILPSCIHTFSSLPVLLTPTSPAISNMCSRTSSASVALPFSFCALLFPLLPVQSPPLPPLS